VAKDKADAITEALNRVYGDGPIEIDPALLAAGLRTLRLRPVAQIPTGLGLERDGRNAVVATRAYQHETTTR